MSKITSASSSSWSQFYFPCSRVGWDEEIYLARDWQKTGYVVEASFQIYRLSPEFPNVIDWPRLRAPLAWEFYLALILIQCIWSSPIHIYRRVPKVKSTSAVSFFIQSVSLSIAETRFIRAQNEVLRSCLTGCDIERCCCVCCPCRPHRSTASSHSHRLRTQGWSGRCIHCSCMGQDSLPRHQYIHS